MSPASAVQCALCAGLAVSAGTGQAAAHSPLAGLEGFYTGLLHPLWSPDQAVALLAIGLLLGSFAMRRLSVVFGIAAIGMVTGLSLGTPTGDPAPWLFGLATCAAGLAALAPGRALPLAAILSLFVGAFLGWASLPDVGPPQDRAFTIGGSVTGVALALLYLTGALDLLRERLKPPWFIIPLRVLAAWIAAVALLMLALRLALPPG